MTMKLNLGCGNDIREGWINVDKRKADGVDFVIDLDGTGWLFPFAPNTCDEFYLSHVLEHISNPLKLLSQMWVVAKPEAKLVIRVPHGAHDMAWADPDHKRAYFPSSFQFFAQPAYKRADYGYTGDWETNLIILRREVDFEVDDEQRLMLYLNHMRNYIGEMEVHMRAFKPRREPSIDWQFSPQLMIE